jgi:hypothetical protein
MSQFYEVYEVNFTKRKPSRAQVLKALSLGLEKGFKAFQINYGENSLNIDLNPHPYNRMGQWLGYGWIKEISGDDIAKELNKTSKQEEEFIKEHFQFIRIGD